MVHFLFPYRPFSHTKLNRILVQNKPTTTIKWLNALLEKEKWRRDILILKYRHTFGSMWNVCFRSLFSLESKKAIPSTCVLPVKQWNSISVFMKPGLLYTPLFSHSSSLPARIYKMVHSSIKCFPQFTTTQGSTNCKLKVWNSADKYKAAPIF